MPQGKLAPVRRSTGACQALEQGMAACFPSLHKNASGRRENVSTRGSDGRGIGRRGHNLGVGA
jgi:hypothetical protein